MKNWLKKIVINLLAIATIFSVAIPQSNAMMVIFTPGVVSGNYSTESLVFDGVDEGGVQTGSAFLSETKSGGRSLGFFIKFVTLPTPATNSYLPIISGASTGGTVATGLWNIGVRTRASAPLQNPRFDFTLRAQSDVVSDVDGAMGSTNLSTDTWYCFVATTDGSDLRMYVDAGLETLNAWAGFGTWGGYWFGDALLSGTLSATLARTGSGGSYGNFKIDELTMWSTQLDSTEITEWCNSGLPIDPSTHSESANLTHEWRFGEGSDDSSTVYDTVGSDDWTLENIESGDFTSDVSS